MLCNCLAAIIVISFILDIGIQTTYRGGRRGGKPFRGGGRGHVRNRGIRPDGSAPSRRGRRSGSLHFASTGVTSTIPNTVSEPSAAAMPPSTLVPGQATLPPQVPAAPVWPPPRMAWCELCRVDCNTPEILEQHKNGKRHKKNMKLQEEMQRVNKVITPHLSVQVPNTGSEVAQSKKVEGSDQEKQHQLEALSSLPTTDDKEKETEQQKDITNKSEASIIGPASTNRKLNGPSEARGRGTKRKMRGGRGGKHKKSNEGPRRPVEPPKPVGGIPFFCELCNVKCESQVVFDSHLAGKKHTANMKKFQGHQALYGEKGLQALYPPNLNAPSSSFIPQTQQDLTDPQVVLAQLLTYVLSQAQVPGLAAAPQVPLPSATLVPSQIPLSSSEMQHLHQFIQGSLVTSETSREVSLKAETEAPPFAGNNKAVCQTSESEKNDMSQQQTIVASTGTDVKMGDGALVLENKPDISGIDNPICATSSTSEKDAKTEPVSNNNLGELGEGSKEADLEEQKE
ncbi:uncharacterized protein LOC120208415 isoform X2 [Hibiscus syriacus]|uniref:uncharacterized protein LOC120208415 isoform X2 n=1 Tax=Hibiscus syriacus TaxID=106335 RepID=UPI0019245580|nr:uncharacterized protein LOC120208415 isoform X2 [Hibiscus syriacus]XP_039063634.1 uncharacterized protein LOC120208415 isoform X2 [Hibiscus syriacus]